MARDQKVVEHELGVDRRESGYYSTPPEVANYLARRLIELKPDAKTALDPCVGAEEISMPFSERGIMVTGFDIQRLKESYTCDFSQKDFIEYYRGLNGTDLFGNNSDHFDLYILNPPYNCHEVDYIRKNKASLKQLFPETGAYNMYTMFLDAVIEMADEGDMIGIITADSFLTAKYHAGLRQKMMNKCILHDLLLCPTDLFWDQKADVRTCIMVLEKGTHKAGHLVRTLQRPEWKEEFFSALQDDKFQYVSTEGLFLTSPVDNFEFIVGVPDDVQKLFDGDRLGQSFSCVTGISTGDDGKFLRKKPEEGFTVPFYKNPGSQKFYCEPQAYIIDDYLQEPARTKNFMVRNKRFLGKEGICCSSMGVRFSACYLPEGSTFGVNPNIFAGDDIWWLMSYLNSSLTLYLLRGVLIRGNMVNAGYVSRLPIVNFSAQQRNELEQIAKEQFLGKSASYNEAIEMIDNIVFAASGLSAESEKLIREFSTSIYKKS